VYKATKDVKPERLVKKKGMYNINLSVYPAAFWESSESKTLDHSDKVILPENVLEQLLRRRHNRLPHPVVFEIEDSRVQKTEAPMMHCGVLQFTAPQGQAYLPTWMFNFLTTRDGPLTEGQKMRFRLRQLEKVQYAKFQSLSPEFAKLPTPRQTLEHMMHGLTTLTEGQLLHLRHKEQEFQLKVLELKPGPAGQLINTNVTVDFDLGSNIGPDQQGPDKLEMGDSSGFTIREDEYAWFMTKVKDTNKAVRLKLEVSSGDPEFYVHYREQKPTRTKFIWSSIDIDDKVVAIKPTDKNWSPWLFIGIHAFRKEAKGVLYLEQIAVEAVDTNQKKVTGLVLSSEVGSNQELCPHCGRAISKANFMMHEMRCARQNWCCPRCKAVINKSEKDKHIHCTSDEKCAKVFSSEEQLEKHITLVHINVPCTKCGQKVAPSNMAFHMEKACIKRSVVCHWCMMHVTLDIKKKHEEECGARTIPCEICRKYVQRRFMEGHRAGAHQINPLIDQYGNVRVRKVDDTGNFEYISKKDPLAEAMAQSILEYEKKELGIVQEEKKELPTTPFIPTTSLHEPLNLEDWYGDGDEDDSMGWDSNDGLDVDDIGNSDGLKEPNMNKQNSQVVAGTRCPYCNKLTNPKVRLDDHLLACEEAQKDAVLEG